MGSRVRNGRAQWMDGKSNLSKRREIVDVAVVVPSVTTGSNASSLALDAG